MFSGIIEANQPIVESRSLNQAYEIRIERPTFFDDLKIGDSISVNGICLTLEELTVDQMSFTLGLETLRVLGPHLESWLSRPVNLERSLKFGDRVHGHLVTGHVESMVPVTKSYSEGDNWILAVKIPSEFRKFYWKKGSVALQGVSLTINSVRDDELEVGLIPETQKRTNLSLFRVGEVVCFESDSFAKAIVEAVQNMKERDGGLSV